MKIIALLAIVLFINCETYSNEVKNVIGNSKYNREVVVIDSCEYLVNYTYRRNYVLTHKGNCKFCQERTKKWMQEIYQTELKNSLYKYMETKPMEKQIPIFNTY